MKARLTLTFALLLICTGAARAADPVPPPPLEEACADETGAAYGLCNAYCEAMDCDGEPEASATACTKVKDKYTQITGHGLPCEAVVNACPCSALPEWNAVLAGTNPECEEGFGNTLQLTTSTGGVGASETFNSCVVFPDNELNITPEQGAACIELLRTYCPVVG